MNDNNIDGQNDTNNPGYFIVGLLLGSFLGGLIGAVTMLFMAPQSGKKARKQLQLKAKRVRKQTVRAVDDGVDQVRSKARQVTTDMQEQAGELQQRGHDAVEQQIEHWTSVVEAQKSAINGS